jgi:uncharacterized protein YbjT (DUF2867 family)
MTTTAVFGASGQTGRRIVDCLLAEGKDVLALNRSPAPHGQKDRVRHEQLDLSVATSNDIASLLHGTNAVVFAAGGDPIGVDRDGAIRTIQAAEKAGVARFVLITGMGVGRTRPASLYGEFWNTYFGAKEASEQALRSSPLEWTILQPGELLNTPGTGCLSIAPTGTLPIGAVSREDVARLVTAALRRSDSIGHTWEVLEGHDRIDDAITKAS